jgi:type II secretion system protein G
MKRTLLWVVIVLPVFLSGCESKMDKGAAMSLEFGNIRYEAGRCMEAAIAYRNAINMKPDFAEAYYGLGKAYDKLRQYPDARAAYQKYLALAPTGKAADQARKRISEIEKLKIDNNAAALLVKLIVLKLEEYRIDIGEYPKEEEGGLNALVVPPTFDDESKAAKWTGPYIKRKQLKDPWGSNLGYEIAETETDDATKLVIHIWSFGANKEDDSGERDDIRSWTDSDEDEYGEFTK